MKTVCKIKGLSFNVGGVDYLIDDISSEVEYTPEEFSESVKLLSEIGLDIFKHLNKKTKEDMNDNDDIIEDLDPIIRQRRLRTLRRYKSSKEPYDY